MLSEDELKIKSYVTISKHRTNIIKKLHNEVLIPSQIAKKTSIRMNHISFYLNQLKSNGLVVCINEDARKGRLYKLTNVGNKIAEDLEKR